MNMNPNCSGSSCQRTGGETRILPIGGNSNLIVCFECYLVEMEWRRERNHDLGVDCQFKLPNWTDLKVHSEIQPEPARKPEPYTFWSHVWARIILNRLNDSTWQACFVSRPAGSEHNRCFMREYVQTCAINEDRAYDLLVTDFLHLSYPWQINLTGRTYSQWCEYERERRLSQDITESYQAYLAYLEGLDGMARYPFTRVVENPPDTLREYRRPFTEEEWKECCKKKAQ